MGFAVLPTSSQSQVGDAVCPATVAQGLVWVAGQTMCSSSNIEINVVFLVSIHI